jgi:DNA polymerase III epsilon subunit-like protein
MTKTYGGLVHLNGNLLASVDLETTGKRAGYHEPIQIAVVPLNSDLRPLDGVRPFYSTIKPLKTIGRKLRRPTSTSWTWSI